MNQSLCRYAFAYAILSLAAVAIGQPTTAPTTAPCYLAVSVDRSNFGGGEPIWTTVTTLSKRSTRISLRDPLTLIHLVVTQDDKPVPLTQFGRSMRELESRWAVMGDAAFLTDGKTDTEQILVSRLFDMSAGGTYKVHATRRVYEISGNDAKPHEIRSDEIKLNVAKENTPYAGRRN